jgi:hypothetical protein
MTLDELVARLAAEHRIEDRGPLVEAIMAAVVVYDSTRNAPDPDTLDRLDAPLFSVIELRSDRVNHQRLVAATARQGHDAVKVSDRLHDLIERLWFIRSAASGAHILIPTRKGPKTKATDLRALVDVLAAYWTSTLGRSFEQNWTIESAGKDKRKRMPTTDAMLFVYSVVEFIDPKRLANLPTVARAAVEAVQHRQPRPQASATGRTKRRAALR